MTGFEIEYPHQPQGFEGFSVFPSRYGYGHNDLVAHAWENGKIASILQSWLFFGLLTETFARPNYCFERQDFIGSIGSGRQVVTTRCLPKYVSYWVAARAHDDRDEMERLETNIDQCLWLTHSILCLFNKQLREQAITESPDSNRDLPSLSAIILSISLLGDYLTTVRRSIRQYTSLPDILWECPLVDRKMQNQGWCAGEISTLRKKCNLSSRYYLASIDRRILNKNHDRCRSSTGCQAHQIDYKSYRTQHRHDCDQTACAEIGPLQERIASAIRNGGSAVTVLKVSETGEISTEPMDVGGEGGQVCRYVAISHVWSDGLGNPSRNCLNICQLRHIQKIVNDLYEPNDRPVPFWIDTLGIPVSKKYAPLRQAAIARIAETFKKADKVLVIDNSLQTCNANMSFVETTMRLQYSVWMTRLWTFLEGRLARNVYFQFSNQAISGAALYESLVVKDNLLQVSSMLQKLPEGKLLSTPSAVQLLKALASAESDDIKGWSRMPPQTEPALEDLRQEAIKRLCDDQGYYSLRQVWEPVLRKLDPEYQPDDNDEHVLADLEMVYCPVKLHAYNSIASTRGGLLALEVDEDTIPNLAVTEPTGITARIFYEVCTGLRARTTSRMDDETVCIGSLLGVDLPRILDIKSMDWRLRDFLNSIDSQRATHRWVARLGMNTRRLSDKSHRERMRELLAQIRIFPVGIVFWNAPRLTYDKWKWAPYSLLYRDLDVQLPWILGNATLCDRGLQFTNSAYRLSRLMDNNSSFKGNSLPSYAKLQDDSLVIKPLGRDTTPPESLRHSWLRIRFLDNDETIKSDSVRRRTWQQYIASGEINRLAVLFQRGIAVLVRIYGQQGDMYLAHHVRLLQQDYNTTAHIAVAAGTWLQNNKWCLA